MNEIEKLEYAYRNVESLAMEVEDGTFLPKRFRNLDRLQWALERPRYVDYLKGELRSIRTRINALLKQFSKTSTATVH